MPRFTWIPYRHHREDDAMFARTIPVRAMVALATLGLLGSMFVASVAADAGSPTTTLDVQPQEISGNPTCASLISSGDFLFEFKFEPVADADDVPLSFGSLTGLLDVDVKNITGGQGFDFDISGDFIAMAVFVKGGPGGNLYDYRPDGADAELMIFGDAGLGDTGLHAPVNPQNNRFYGLSHISFCIGEAPQEGALRIVKESTKTDTLVSNAGATFSYNGSSVTDNGAGDENDTIGEICVSGLAVGDYTVNETAPPSGYGDADESNVTATVVADTNCTDNLPALDDAAVFTNPPLADVQIRWRDGGSGETMLDEDLDCVVGNGTGTEDTTDTTGWDDTLTVTDIEIDPSPVTITCTVVIDP